MRHVSRAGAIVAAIALVLLLLAPGRAGDETRRIVSINLCADQYLLAMVPRDEIVALSPSADAPMLSDAAEKAFGIPRIRDDAESALALSPDLVLASVYTAPATLALLKRQGVDVFVLPDASNFAELRDQIDAIAGALEAYEQSERLKKKLDSALAQLDGLGRGLSGLYLDRGGFVTGSETLIGALFRQAKLKNAAAPLGVDFIAPVPLEVALTVKPDVVVTPDRRGEADQGALMLRHPALDELARRKTIHMPVAETICPGPSWVDAINRFAEGLRAIR